LPPQFVTPDGPVLLSSIGLGVLWAVVTGCGYVVFTWGVERGRALLSRPAARRGLRVATGVTLIGLGVMVAAGG
jgi:threonine/homoserine/homoserine lactone efflux protein